MSEEQKLKTAAISQDVFPGAFIEPKWSKLDQIKNSPFYAMRLTLGSNLTYSPRGQEDFVSLTFEGCEFILHRDNFKLVKELNYQYLTTFLASKGFTNGLPLRYHPELILDGLQFLIEKTYQLLDVPLEKTRMFWILPDIGACGEYRSRKPYLYMSNLFYGQHSHVTNFYAEHAEFANLSSITYFDAFIMHRAPPAKLLSVFQSLKQSGKTLIFEYDDDIFNIPEWNHNVDKIDINAQHRARTAIELSDLIICTTEELRNVSQFPERSMVGPNLIDVNDFGERLQCDRVLDERIAGYVPHRNNKKIEYHHSKKCTIYNLTEQEYNPIRILWAGSNTHDADLQQIIEPVIKLGKKYGIAVRFIFFGYCPSKFIEAEVNPGNTKPKFVVKNAFAHYIQYIEAVKYTDYMSVLRSIDPDIALCPLSDVAFNLSKSPLKMLEMGALGIPCVVSDFGPYKEFTDMDTCIKVPLEDRSAWEKAIEELIINTSFRKCLSDNIHDTVIKEYSWNCDSVNRQKWDLIFNRIHEIASSKKTEFCKMMEI